MGSLLAYGVGVAKEQCGMGVAKGYSDGQLDSR